MLDQFSESKGPTFLLVVNNTNGDTEYYFKESLDEGKELVRINVNPTKGFQPLVLNLLNRQFNGILYMDKNDGKNPERRYYIPSENKTYPLKTFLHKGSIVFDEPSITSPHSASFVDLNGDCHPDLVLTSYDPNKKTFYIEYWLYISHNNYTLYNCTSLEDVNNTTDISQLVFADFGIILSNSVENKGSFDIMFYRKDIHKFYRVRNTFVPKKKSSITTVELCYGFNINDKEKLSTLVFSILTL